MAGILDALAETWPARMGRGILSAAMLPGDVWAGRAQLPSSQGILGSVPPGDPAGDQSMARAADLAGLVMGGAYAAPPVAGGAGMGIRAYHGSPHDFDRFDMSKIGTGEGAQAYGHGLYFAENPKVAADYRNRLSDRSADFGAFRNNQGADFSILDGPKGLGALIDTFSNVDVPHSELIARAVKNREYFNNPDFRGPLIARNKQEAQQLLDWLRDNPINWKSNPERGRMYEVNINAKPEQFLDWDKPLAGQANEIRAIPQLEEAARTEAYNRALSATLQSRRDELFDMVKNPLSAPGGFAYEHLAPRERFGVRKETATNILRDAGIPGIKYLDQGSRGTGQGTSNYVLFRDDIIDILRKYGLAGMLGAGAATQSATPEQSQ